MSKDVPKYYGCVECPSRFTNATEGEEHSNANHHTVLHAGRKAEWYRPLSQYTLRRTVHIFALLMEKKLSAHDRDQGIRGWEGDDPLDLWKRFEEERHEFTEALHDLIAIQKVNGKREINLDAKVQELIEQLAEEAADLANFAMMVVDVCEGLKPPKLCMVTHCEAVALPDNVYCPPCNERI